MGNEFMTTDIYMAAALRAIGHEMLRGDMVSERRMKFVFKLNDTIKSDSERYHNHQLGIDSMQKFANEIKSLKTYLYTTNSN